jgi:transcriptional regulator with XRE-family HTH domain
MELEKWEMKVGRNIRKYRVKRGHTLQQAADQFGCALRTWQRFEEGTNNFELYTIIRIAKVLKIQPWRLWK